MVDEVLLMKLTDNHSNGSDHSNGSTAGEEEEEVTYYTSGGEVSGRGYIMGGVTLLLMYVVDCLQILK